MNFDSELFLTNASAFDTVISQATDWSGASPCDAWSAAGVLDHVIDTQRDFLSERGFGLGERPAGAPAEVWKAHLASARAVLADSAAGRTAYDGWFGPTTVGDSLARFYGFDLVVHRWTSRARQAATPPGRTRRWTSSTSPSSRSGRRSTPKGSALLPSRCPTTRRARPGCWAPWVGPPEPCPGH